ncbi:MAG TPA: glycoside hydrolase family 2 TIM barrel-domain containing protein [Ohtaekwangia sp.]|uniref:glycoside hydrolase family 2 TIM barrel-domain containing protein n=1 Tax=Ohtaekwangia sp. TaxID=2066019 RepID=UPI002F95EF4A
MKQRNKLLLAAAFIACLVTSCKQKETTTDTTVPVPAVREVWTKDQANEWYKQWGWLRGSDFIPSTAINQLEMWQAETFDTATINRELGWAESIGLNSMRVYLHHLAWQVDSTGFKDRVNQYLGIADKHHISTLFVLFDDCWSPVYQAGKQPEPKTGIHNSGWVRDPGDKLHEDSTLYITLEKYTKDILSHFASDKRIVLWDVYNEPGNSGYGTKSLPLLSKVFQWGREVNPSQPLSAGVWSKDLEELNRYQLANSDVITYHNYSVPEDHQQWIDSLRTYGKPLICTEYMARTRGSRFDNIMPILKEQNIAAYNWGLVAGKTNTIYAWDTPMPDGKEPKIWFHDIFRKDGTPYSKEEIALIKKLTGK